MKIQLVDAAGRIAASTQFTPPPRASYGPCGTIEPPPVRVAAGSVYFADSTGLVRKMSVSGAVADVTTFKLSNPQQALSFAVSPDGGQLIAIIIGTPPLHDPPPKQLGDPWFGTGTYTLDLETAPAGGQASAVLHRDFGSNFVSPTLITGWDAVGPTATLNSYVCTQNGLPSLRYTSGALIHLGMDGTHLERIGGPDCEAWDELENGTVLCGAADWQSFTVRTRSGDVIWSGGGGEMFDVRLSPDATAVASTSGQVYLRYPVANASYARKADPQAQIVGWAGRGVVVEVHTDGAIGTAPATDPTMFNALGLTVDKPCATCGFNEVTALGTIS